MHKLLLAGCFSLTLFSATAQDNVQYHSPAEILQIMTNSKLTYTLDKLAKPVTAPQYDQLTTNTVYRTGADNDYTVKEYRLNDTTSNTFKQAEAAFEKQDYDNAQKLYMHAYELDPKFYLAKTYVAEIYWIKKDFANAERLYKEVIQANYIAYDAHWFLANVYEAERKYNEAADEITIASILNRNNPRLLEAMDNIYKDAKLKKADWDFVPQYEMSYDDKAIHLSLNEDWTMYGICKAVWKYEPGYCQKMGQQSPESNSMVQERECCYNEAVMLEKTKTHDKALLAMKKAVKDSNLDYFILYEIILRTNPAIAFQLSEKNIEGMKNYVLEAHGGKKIKH